MINAIKKYINIAIYGLLIISISFIFIQRCSLKKLKKENKYLKDTINYYNMMLDYQKRIKKFENEENNRVRREINNVNNEENMDNLIDKANNIFNRMHENNIQTNGNRATQQAN